MKLDGALFVLVVVWSQSLVGSLLAWDDEPTEQSRPNILWITIEDWSADLSCYGTPGIQTPFVDALAAQGVRYERAFTTSPVCSTSRSAMMTGYHQNYIGANQHRENNKRPLPDGIRPIPHWLADAGYFTALMSNKLDLNFTPNSKKELFMGTDWKQRKEGQPFFARVTFAGTHRAWQRDAERPISIDDVVIPPYYPDTPFIRRDWANGLEQMQIVDRQVGKVLKRLDDEGLAENTIVFFIADHGRCHIRGKQFLYDGGIRIPMIMRWPSKLAAGQVNDDLVTSLDICATILDVAGVKPLVPLHGQSLLGDEVKQRRYIYAARDKMDETHDSMRCIRSKTHKLILNLMPERAYCQYNRYKEASCPALAEMNVLNLKSKLTTQQAAFLASKKPAVELYDLQADPYEVNNIALDPRYANVKKELMDALDHWRKGVIGDKGISDDFRAAEIYPDKCPLPKVDDWVHANGTEFDFRKNGWPRWYPTRTLEDWEKVREAWEPYVFRKPGSKVKRPSITHPRKPKKRIRTKKTQANKK